MIEVGQTKPDFDYGLARRPTVLLLEALIYAMSAVGT